MGVASFRRGPRPSPVAQGVPPALAGDELAVFQAEALHLLVERRAIDAELIGRRVAIPAVRFEHVANDLPLRSFERFLQRLLAGG